MEENEMEIIKSWKRDLEARKNEINIEIEDYKNKYNESVVKRKTIEDAISRGGIFLKHRSESFRNYFEYDKICNSVSFLHKDYSEKKDEYQDELGNINDMIKHLDFLLENN